MSLQEQLASLVARAKAAMPSEIIVSMQRDLDRLSRSGLAQQSIQVGEQAPDFTLPDALGQPVTLSARLLQGPVVVAFYHGAWCHDSNVQLRARPSHSATDSGTGGVSGGDLATDSRSHPLPGREACLWLSWC